MVAVTRLSVTLRKLPVLLEHEFNIFTINVSYNTLIFVYQLRRYRPVFLRFLILIKTHLIYLK